MAPPAFPAPILSNSGLEQQQVDGLGDYVGSYYIRQQTSLDGVGAWSDGAIWPLDADPYTMDCAGQSGLYSRVALADGLGDPLGPWSNVVQVA